MQYSPGEEDRSRRHAAPILAMKIGGSGGEDRGGLDRTDGHPQGRADPFHQS
jgi:hypothetical protein